MYIICMYMCKTKKVKKTKKKTVKMTGKLSHV